MENSKCTSGCLLKQAEQQLLGYLYAKQGWTITDLVMGMGLSYDEWEILKQDEDLLEKLTDAEIENIEKAID